jgi:hypothetical protein
LRSRLLILLVACIASASLGVARGADHIKDFTKAKKSLQQQLRSKQPDMRASAIAQLGQFPIADAVRLVHGGLYDADDKVREAAYTSLLKQGDKQEVCDTLLVIAKKDLNRPDGGLAAAPSLAVLLTSNLPSVRRDVLAFVDGTVVSSKNGVEVLVTLADELGAHHSVADVQPLARLSKTKSFANHFGLRRAVVAALTKIPDRQALGALIEMLPQLGGEAGTDAIEHLTQVTEQIFAADSDAWGRWWDDNRDSFEYPTRSVQTPYRQASLEGAAGYYYGLPLFAQRLVFVLDTSGSMHGPRIEAAKRELTRAIGGLPEHAHFGIVVFNGTVSVWQRQLVAATEAAKKTAMHYVSVQGTHSNTASYDALEAAMEFDTEAIYFLSDGAPYGGKITAPVDIVAAITAANKSRRISIYTIGIGAGIPGGPLDMFLKNLAEQNLGLYRRVDG